MKINSVHTPAHSSKDNTIQKNARKLEEEVKPEKEKSVDSAQTDSGKKSIKNVTYKKPLDANELREIEAQVEKVYESLRTIVRDMLMQQGKTVDRLEPIDRIEVVINIDLIKIDAELITTDESGVEPGTSVEESIDWGFKATADRIMSFAKTLVGEDPSKINLLRDAVKEGFAEAEKAYGDTLPQISKDTYEEVMKQFDDWEAEAANV